MTDHYFQFPDETTCHNVLTGLNMVDEKTGNYLTSISGACIDVVGKIVDTPAAFDEKMNLLTEETFIEGWHVNIRTYGYEIPEELAGYEIKAPITPSRKWA